jgi:hypothetical protein
MRRRLNDCILGRTVTDGGDVSDRDDEWHMAE